MRTSLIRCALLSATNLSVALTAFAVNGQNAPSQPIAASTPADSAAAPIDTIVVTARRREETLISTPVVVSVLSADDMARSNADDLTKIGELTPTVIVGTYKANGGGSIAIRGISSPANQTGFEQAVSVALDGIQTSNGRVAQLGFFDLEQVEVLKGPQALLFGKNSPAGVISVKTAGPTSTFEISGRASFEFVADEVATEAAISGPLGESWGGRMAVRYRHMDGWMRNLAQPTANPFYRAATGAPAAAAQLPGTSDRRPGDEELLGRLTLEFDRGGNLDGTLKVLGARSTDAGAGVATQNIGPCVDGRPRVSGVPDPFGECIIDDRTTVGDVPQVIGRTLRGLDTDGQAEGELNAVVSSVDLEATFGDITVASLTGYNYFEYDWISGLDQTTFSQLAQFEGQEFSEFSQEVRLSTDFDSAFNFLVGAYYQRTNIDLHQDVKLNDALYNLAADRYVAFESLAGAQGSTLSAFGQLLLDVTDEIELAGGLRWTREKKDVEKFNTYGVSVFNTSNTVYPGSDETGVLKGDFEDDNVSPEVTLTWRPDSDRTLYVAYKTGFKSGGFGLTNPLQVSTRISGIDFNSEEADGFELGAKGLFLNNRLRLGFAAFSYDFSNLQVNTYDPALIAFTINNAGEVSQRGAELEANYQANDILTLHAAVAHVRNRFKDFTGQCYAYAFPTGATRATAVAPPNCSFANDTTLTLQQVFDERAPARSPDWAGNAGFIIDVPFGGYKFGLTADAFYSDSYFSAETMAPSTFQKDFWRVNASISIGAADDQWTISLIGRNLTNEYYLLYAADRTGGAGVPGAIGEQRGVVARGRETLLWAGVKF